MQDDQAQGMHSASLLKKVFALEIPVSGNGRVLREQKGRQSNRQWQLRRAVYPFRLKDAKGKILDRKMRIRRNVDE